jgi:myo-inositol 2-dehydrogenase/D-chiro-inositol 1-dehydrogenase
VYDPVATIAGRSAYDDPAALIRAADAVIIASPDDTHERYAQVCLDAGRRVLCEKPLAVTAAGALRLARADTAGLIQVGFMRRYDPGYCLLKQRLDAGEVGAPLLMHCVHRNASAPPGFTSESLLISSATHEIDAARWLLGEEVAEVTVCTPRAGGLLDPQLVVLRMASGVLIDVEVFVNARYGYEVRCELVGESGVVELAREPVTADWRDRFAAAYRAELRAWIAGEPGPSAWDGYAATAVAEVAVASLRTGRTVRVT